MSAAVDVLSPELVLVSPPEDAARARAQLPELVPFHASPPPAIATRSRAGAAFFDAMCVAGTLGPLLLAVFAR